MLHILEIPFLYNKIRQVIAGDQDGTKEYIASILKKNKCKRVLDLCCGTGDFAICTPANASYLGIDNNPQYIKYANDKYVSNKNMHFEARDLMSGKYKLKDRFDSVLLVSTLHHFSDKELSILFEIIKKNVRGFVIIADLDGNPPTIIQKILLKLDRGHFVRPNSEKMKLIKPYFKVIETDKINSRLALQFMIICKS